MKYNFYPKFGRALTKSEKFKKRTKNKEITLKKVMT